MTFVGLQADANCKVIDRGTLKEMTMATNTPQPWHYEEIDICETTKESFGELVAANGIHVADSIYKSDAELIINALSPKTV
jgi:hypothetical protein